MMQNIEQVKKSNNKLGQGISALISAERQQNNTLNQTQSKDAVLDIDINKIEAGVYQPRHNFDKSKLDELAQSIKENSIIQPIIVRPNNEKQDKYEIIAGERRFRASKIAGLKTIPAIVKKVNNHQALEIALIENIQRSELSVIDEAKGYKRLASEFSYTQDQISSKVGKSRSHIANLMRLLLLPSAVQGLVDDGLISMGHARALINSDKAQEIAEEILERSLTVRDVEKIISNEFKGLKKVSNTKFKGKAQEFSDVEKRLSLATNMDSEVKYNISKKYGQLVLKFSDINQVEQLIKNLNEYNSQKIS